MSDQRYGPNTAQVERLIERVGKLDQEAAQALADAWDAAWGKEMDEAVGSMFASLCEDFREDFRRRALNAAGREVLWSTPSVGVLELSACNALWYAAAALAVRDLIDPQDFETLVAPVASVLGRCWDEVR